MSENNGTNHTSLRLKTGLAEMLKGGVIMDVMSVEQAEVAEKAGATSVMALERVPAIIRAEGGVSRMANPKLIKQIMDDRVDPGDGQMPHRPLRRSARSCRRLASTTSMSPKC